MRYHDAAARAVWQIEEIPIYCCLGRHPKVCNELCGDVLDQLDQELMLPDVVALGEIGLDYSGLRVNHNSQMHMLRQLVRMAKFGNFPVVVNCWDKKGSSAAYCDCLRVLESELFPTHPV